MQAGIRCVGAALALLLIGCGGGGVTTDAGDGTAALQVRVKVELQGSNADLEVNVRRNGNDVSDASVLISSDLGDTELAFAGGGDYKGQQSGHARWYAVDVEAGPDWLEGSVVAVEPAQITDPDPTAPWRPREADDSVILLRWSGAYADHVQISTDGFEWEGEDRGEYSIPVTVFEETEDEVEIRRRNRTDLAGGAGDSWFEVTAETGTAISIVDPY